ncbi:hypothetical protein [Cylindrospermopsis raciborskii]|nr:hypothetical protein [Cylindrospermopsis raciborskii]
MLLGYLQGDCLYTLSPGSFSRENLNILKGDREALPKGDCIALPKGDRS